ncbi:MAG: hypothetical protein R3A13_01435 [Bdellovibrionota bacterium]
MNDNLTTYRQCIHCGAKAAIAKTDLPFEGLVNGSAVNFHGPGLLCTECNQHWATGVDMQEHDVLKAEAYRKANGLMTTGEMEKIRKN